jgi:glycosyltransferase involved in cell wall biosynthesis
MSLKPPLSVYIIASNEADRIARTIRSAQAVSDDIIVVEDGKSIDDTIAVAEAAGARVIVNPWPGFGEQKRFAEEQCQHDWLLCLDADEVLTPALQEEIRHLFKFSAPELSFYKMKVTEVYPHADKPRALAKPTNVVRLFNRRHGRTSTSAVHDRVEIPPGVPIGQLQNICLHYSIRSLAHLIAKYDEYTTLAAKTLKKKRGPLTLRLFTEYPLMFLKYYFLHTHFTGGAYGFAVAKAKANARWARIAKMWEAATS